VRRFAWLLCAALATSAAAHEGAAPDAGESGGDGHAASGSQGSLRYEPPAPGTYELPPIQTLERHRVLGSEGGETELLEIGAGQVALVSLVYLSCPHQCPMTHAVFQKIDRSLAGDAELDGRVELVTVSFDPARDTPERMAALRRQLAPQSGWRFVTAPNAAALAPVLEDFGQDTRAADSVAAGRIDHVLKVFLVDSERRVRNVYSAEFLDARLLMNDARTVLREAHTAALP